MTLAALVPGQTPIDPDEAAGLKPTHITQQDHLNAWEQENIRTGRRWALQQVRKKVDLLDQVFVRQLHRRMFGDTWEWAGTYRNTDKTIGVPWEQIGPKLAQLLGNTQYQIDNAVFPADELAVRFHHALVWIHPFPNGNGRHSRMMGDLLAMQLGAPAFTWGAGADLYATGLSRADYIAALKAADANDFRPLLAFAKS